MPQQIVPNIFKIYKDKLAGHCLCPCGLKMTGNGNHGEGRNKLHNIGPTDLDEFLSQIHELNYLRKLDRILEMDFNMLGDASQRSPLLGSIED